MKEQAANSTQLHRTSTGVGDMILLAERCEKATGVDRDIDDALHRIAIGSEPFNSASARRYTASIDAAMTLVPEGWSPAIDCRSERPFASVESSLDADPFTFGSRKGQGYGATPALALCAAALRARDGLLNYKDG